MSTVCLESCVEDSEDGPSTVISKFSPWIENLENSGKLAA